MTTFDPDAFRQLRADNDALKRHRDSLADENAKLEMQLVEIGNIWGKWDSGKYGQPLAEAAFQALMDIHDVLTGNK